ncbi:MAG: hypothetical protein IBJ03_00825 [Gemmatimonadaceae bacterium]|nr:hypothetical protein [Gemmatimonadaceae bacterium]
MFTSSGHAIICNGAEHEIVVLDSNGIEQWRLGREGRGPGEFREISSVSDEGTDRIGIFDARSKKFVLVNTRGELISDQSTKFLRGWMPLYLGSLNDGRLVFLHSTSGAPPLGVSNAIVPLRTAIELIDTSGNSTVAIDTITLYERFVMGQGVGGITIGLPLSAGGKAVVGAGQLVTAFSADSFVVKRSLATSIAETLAVSLPAHPVSQSEWDLAIRNRMATTASDFRDRVSKALSMVARPKTHPRFRSMHVSPRGSIALLAPSNGDMKTYSISCVTIVDDDICPDGILGSGDELLAISSGRALVARELEEGNYRIEMWVRR